MSLYWLLLLPTFPILLRFFRSSWIRGKWGELKINIGISLLLDRKVYRLIKHVTLRIDDHTTQIDHIVCSPYGIFVIETKNMNGWIFGRADHTQWTQVIFRFKKRFLNPLIQNKKHTRAVQEILGLPSQHVRSVVAFVGTATLKTPMPIEITQGIRGLVSLIRTHQTLVFSDEDVGRFVQMITERRVKPGFFTDINHARSSKKRILTAALHSGARCPRCGSPMIERIDRRTERSFLGCRRFPICRGTRPLQDSMDANATT